MISRSLVAYILKYGAHSRNSLPMRRALSLAALSVSISVRSCPFKMVCTHTIQTVIQSLSFTALHRRTDQLLNV